MRYKLLMVAALVVVGMGAYQMATWLGGPSPLQAEQTTVAAAASQTPQPTYTLYPTYTPLATHTPYPTATPYPTYTVAPQATCPPCAATVMALPATPSTATPTATSTSTPVPTSTPTDATSYLLPDLRVLPPYALFVQTTDAGVREIRFDTTTINLGDGPLVMRGEGNEQENQTRVVQLLFKEDGGTDERMVGSFVRHPDHRHWHYESFSEMEMFTLNADQSLDELVTTTGKITSCVHDLWRLSSPPPHSPAEGPYARCGREVQGLSVGWADTYDAILPGQQLDITNVPDGQYALRLWVNRDQSIIETTYDNNSVIILIAIEGNTITWL